MLSMVLGVKWWSSTGLSSSAQKICFKSNSLQYDSCGYAAHEQGFAQMKAFFNDKCWVSAVDRRLISR